MPASSPSSPARRRAPAAAGHRAARWSLPGLVVLVDVVALGLLGGGNPDFGFAAFALGLAGLATTLVVAYRLPAERPLPRGLAAALALIVLAPLVQLVPLPPGLWQQLPGQELRLLTLGMIGARDTWQPISLAPLDTAYTVSAAIGFAALLLGLVLLEPAEFRRCLRAAWLVIGFGIVVGVVQIATGGAFPRFYATEHTGALLGMFANKNHMGLALACSIPLAAYLLPALTHRRGGSDVLLAAYGVVALAAIVTTNSRAGLVLGLLACGAVIAQRFRGLAPRWRILLVVGALLIAVVVATSSVVEALYARFDIVREDYRWRFTLQSLPLLRQYWPLGAGAGSFPQLFAAHEQLDWVKSTYVNHVHDDYLELAIEYGLLALPGLAALLGVVGAALWRLRGTSEATLRRAYCGVVIVALFAIHSAVDYPLRRPATLVIFVVALAMVLRPPIPAAPADDDRDAGRRAR